MIWTLSALCLAGGLWMADRMALSRATEAVFGRGEAAISRTDGSPQRFPIWDPSTGGAEAPPPVAAVIAGFDDAIMGALVRYELPGDASVRCRVTPFSFRCNGPWVVKFRSEQG